jgi:hypothetical protein
MESPSDARSRKPPEQARQMLVTSRRCLNWFAKNFGERYSFAAVSKGEVVFVVAKGEKGAELRRIAESWGKVDDLERFG